MNRHRSIVGSMHQSCSWTRSDGQEWHADSGGSLCQRGKATRYGVRDAGMMSKSVMSEWKGNVEPRKYVYHQSSILGVDTSLLERFCPPFYNEFLQTLGVLPPGGGKI